MRIVKYKYLEIIIIQFKIIIITILMIIVMHEV
jgi:hypothetical protein